MDEPFGAWPYPSTMRRDVFERSSITEVNKQYAHSITEIVNFATNWIGWYKDRARNNFGHWVVGQLGRDALIHLDAAAGLFKQNNTHALPLILRPLSEVLLKTRYIQEGDRDARSQAIAYCSRLLRLRDLEQLDPTTREGMSTRASLAKDRTGTSYSLDPTDVPQSIAALQSELQSHAFSLAHAEYLRLTATRRPGAIDWYHFFTRSNDRRTLAEELGESGAYLMVFRYYSDHVHAGAQHKWTQAGDIPTLRAEESEYYFGLAWMLAQRLLRIWLDEAQPPGRIYYDWSVKCALEGLPGFREMELSDPNGKIVSLKFLSEKLAQHPGKPRLI
jgi:hypothetical protein